MPPAGKSPPRKRRNHDELAISHAPDRRDQTQSDLHPGQLLRANPSADRPRHLQTSRRMVRLPRRETNAHLSSRLPAPQSRSQTRSLERPAKSNGRPRLATKKTLMSPLAGSAGVPPALLRLSLKLPLNL